MKKTSWTILTALSASAFAWGGCSSGGLVPSDHPPPPSGGSSSGGAAATGGSTTGGATSGGTGGAATGGAATGGMGGEAPVERPACADIPTLEQGDVGAFTLVVEGFEECEPIPAAHTCEAKPFPEGTSPLIEWSGAPAGTMSFAVVFKDIAILEITDPTDTMAYNRGYHWTIWDISVSTLSLPAGLPEGHLLTSSLAGARQWANFKDYAFFGPCPNFDPEMPTDFEDSYSFVLYALPDVPPVVIPETVTTTNTVRAMDDYFKSVALAAVEYRGTSNAHSSGVPEGVLPPTAIPPCTATTTPPDCLAGVP